MKLRSRLLFSMLLALYPAQLALAQNHAMCDMALASDASSWKSLLGTNQAYPETAWLSSFQKVPKRPSNHPPQDMPAMLSLWVAPTNNVARTSMTGWVNYWTRLPNEPVRAYDTAAYMTAPKLVTLPLALTIAGYPTSQLSITADGAIYLNNPGRALTAANPGRSGGYPVLLPFGDKLEILPGSRIRSGTVTIEGRDLAHASNEPNNQVFVVEFSNYGVRNGNGSKLSVQVVFWSDGLVKFYYRPTYTTQTTVPSLLLVPGLWIGFDAGNGQSISIPPASVLVDDAEIPIWENGTLRPGWAFFNSSDLAQAQRSVGIIGERTYGNTSIKTMDISFCDDNAFFLAAWDFSRDLLDVKSMPQFHVEYEKPDQPSISLTAWAFDEARWVGLSWGSNPIRPLATDWKATDNIDQSACKADQATRAIWCKRDFNASISYPGLQPQVTEARMDSTPVNAVKFSATYWKKGVYYSPASLANPVQVKFRKITLKPAIGSIRSVEIMGNLNPIGLISGKTVTSNTLTEIGTKSTDTSFHPYDVYISGSTPDQLLNWGVQTTNNQQCNKEIT